MEADLFEIIRREWRSAAPRLAAWVFEHMVNRKDVWGQYTELNEKEKLANPRGYKALTLPQRSMRGKDMVTLDKLSRHFRCHSVGHLIGLHAISRENTCRWLALDIDWHEPDALDAEEGARRNMSAALSWWEELQAMGYDPLLLDSNGAGGFHLIIFFEEPAPAEDVHALGQRLAAQWKAKNLDGPPEQFPKTAALSGDKLGAWLRVFGMHHTRPHFTRVWSGDPWLDEPWLDGTAAIEAILGIQLGPPPPRLDVEARTEAPLIVEKGKRGKKRSFASTKTRPILCVDLDGVLAAYDGWEGMKQIGEPLPGALEFMRDLHAIADLTIYSSRFEGAKDPEAVERAIRNWLVSNGFPFDRIYRDVGKPKAHAYIDDRAVPCRPQEDGPAGFEEAASRVRQLCGL